MEMEGGQFLFSQIQTSFYGLSKNKLYMYTFTFPLPLYVESKHVLITSYLQICFEENTY